ncbi:outer membrane beta-barrel protein [bacterium]|nr:outer membrane beta-barrel protein [candidate division CSSED10-310 bacterium]
MKYTLTAVLTVLLLVPHPALAGDHTFSLGVHYFYTIDQISAELEDDLGDSFHEEGLGYNFGYRYKFNPRFGLLAEAQLYPDGYLDADSVFSPRILAVLGRSLYIGIGVGWNSVEWENLTHDLHKSDNWTDSFYLLRLGLEFPILVEHLHLDINANYEFNNWNDVEEFDSDIITFGAGIKITI